MSRVREVQGYAIAVSCLCMLHRVLETEGSDDGLDRERSASAFLHPVELHVSSCFETSLSLHVHHTRSMAYLTDRHAIAG